MKNFVLFILIGVLPYSVQSQSLEETVQGITNQNMEQLQSSLSNWIELTINSNPSSMNKRDAIEKIQSYLKKIQPTIYQKGHKGNLSESNYMVGTLSSSEGKHRLYVYAEKRNGLVTEIRLSAVQ